MEALICLSLAVITTVVAGAQGLFPVGSSPIAVAVNPVTNKVYVANYGSNTVTVFDGATNATPAVTVGSNPVAVAVNPVTNKVYVANYGGTTVTVIDGATNATTTVTVGGKPIAVAVNPVTNKVYVANYDSGTLTVIDGATNVPLAVTVGSRPAAVAVNLVTNKIYVANYGGTSGTTVTVIDGATNATATVTAGTAPDAVAVNPVTNKVYVANYGGNTVTVIDGDAHQPIPLTTAITGVSDALTVATDNVFQTENVSPSFTVGVTSAFTHSIAYTGLGTAVDPPPTAVYYEVDGGNTLTAATGTSAGGANPASFKITPSAQSVGLHTLYVYSAYGNEGGQNSTGNSPEIGNMAAYTFLIDPTSTATAVKADVNPQNNGSNVTFTATITPVAAGTSGPTGVVLFSDGMTLLGSGTLQQGSGSYTASRQTSSLGVGTHTISATYLGDGAYAASVGTLTEKIVGPPTSIVATSGGNQTGVYGTSIANPLVATVTDPNGTPVPSATVTFSGSGLTFSSTTVATNATGVAQTTVTPAATGPRTASATVTGVSAPATFALTIAQAATVTSLKAGSSSAAQGASVTLDAQVASATTGTPTGTVNLNDGTTLLSTVTLTGGAASYTTAPLSAGAHMLYAVYSGDPNFASSSTATGTLVTAGTLDFTLTLSGGQSETVAAGSLAAYTFAIAPTSGTYPGMVTFVASGLPTGATAAFSPGSIAAGAGTQTVTVTIQTSAVKAMARSPSTRDRMARLALALLLLPLVGSGRMRRNMGRLLNLTLLLAGMTATSLLFTGCGGGASTTSTPKSFPVTITATSGNLQHTAAVTLNVQ